MISFSTATAIKDCYGSQLLVHSWKLSLLVHLIHLYKRDISKFHIARPQLTCRALVCASTNTASNKALARQLKGRVHYLWWDYSDNLNITANVCTTTLGHVEERNTCCDVISRGLHHAHTYPAATQKRCGCFMFMSTYVQMHVHKIFSLRVARYVQLLKRRVRAVNMMIKMTI